jgi:hypothetical protein
MMEPTQQQQDQIFGVKASYLVGALVVCLAVGAIGYSTYSFDGTCIPVPCKAYGIGCWVLAGLGIFVALPLQCAAKLRIAADGFSAPGMDSKVHWAEVTAVRSLAITSRFTFPCCCISWGRDAVAIDFTAALATGKKTHGADLILDHFNYRMPTEAFVAKLNSMRTAATQSSYAPPTLAPRFSSNAPATFSAPAAVDESREVQSSPAVASGPPGVCRSIGPLNVRAAPATSALKRRTLAASEQVTISEYRSVKGTDWGRIGQDEWVMVINNAGVRFLEPVLRAAG